MARRYGRSLHRTDCRDKRQIERFPRKLCKLVGKEAKRPPPMVQTDEARSYFSQVRIIIHVIAATPSGTIPTSRFFPTQGRATICRCVSQLKARKHEMQPAKRRNRAGELPREECRRTDRCPNVDYVRGQGHPWNAHG